MRYRALAFALFSFAVVLTGFSGGGGQFSVPILPSAASLATSCTTATVGSHHSCQIAVSNGKVPFTRTITGLLSEMIHLGGRS